jgi:hypothetical protein
MPMLVLAVAEYFDKLLEDGVVAAMTALGKPSGIMVMTIHASVMLVVAVLCSKYRRAD